jgi:integrase
MAWLYQQRDSNHWWIGYRVRGKLHRATTRTADKTEAKRELERINAMFAAQRAGPSALEKVYRALSGDTSATEDTMLVDAVDQWLDECRKSAAAATLDRYTEIIERFKKSQDADSKGPSLRAVNTKIVRSYLSKRRATLSASSHNLERKILGAFFQWAFQAEMIDANPIRRIKGAKPSKEEKRRRRAFTLAEINSIFEKCPNDFWRYMVLMGFYTGQRMGDLIRLPWGALDFEKGLIDLYQSKTDTHVTIPLAKRLRAFLNDLRGRVAITKPADPIWPEQAAAYERSGAGQFSNEFYDILSSCGLVAPRTSKQAQKKGRSVARAITPVSFHCLRHTFVSMLKATGASQATAKELAGHSSDQVSDLYTHGDPKVIAKAINKLPEVS